MLCRKKMGVPVWEEFNANVKCNRCDGVKAGWTYSKRVVIYVLFAVLGGSLVTSHWNLEDKRKRKAVVQSKAGITSLLSSFCGPLHFVTSLLCFALAFFATKLENEAPKAADAAVFLPKHDNMHCTNTVPWIVSNLLNWSDSFHWNLDKEGHRTRVAHLPFAAMFDLWSSSFLPEDRKKTCCFFIETLTASRNQY